MSKFDESLEFVVRHYQQGMFRPDRRFMPYWSWRRISVAASVAIGVLVASAALYVYMTPSAPKAVAPEVTAPAPVIETAPATEAKVVNITFNDAPLSEVVSEIENVYDVRVGNLGNDGTLRLTLSYEGTASELLEIINDTLGTNLTIEEN